MTNSARWCRQFLKHHAEALFIVVFLLADCFLAGWTLTIATIAAISYVVVPAFVSLKKLDPLGKITYLKAFVKTPKVQRLAILLFWVYSIRLLLSAVVQARLFEAPTSSGQLPTMASALIIGAQQFAPLAVLASPIWFFAGACFCSMLMRSCAKATKQDPDLVRQRKTWSGFTYFAFLCAYFGSIITVAQDMKGPAYTLSHWLLNSAKDANFFGNSLGMAPHFTEVYAPVDLRGSFANLSFVQPFDNFVVASFIIVLSLFFLPSALKLSAFLTSFCWRVASAGSLQNMIEAFLEALRLPSRTLVFKEAHPFWNNALRTLVWLLFCYSTLFWLFGFCGGPLGLAIQNWMVASALDANFMCDSSTCDWIFQPQFRNFLGSIVALYATAPIAVTASVVLPYAQARKLVLNCDGILLTQGPYFSMWGRQFRLWSDIKNMSVKRVSRPNLPLKAEYTLNFRSGGQLKFNDSQMSAQDLKVFLDALDEHAVACSVSPEVFSVCQSFEDVVKAEAASDGIDHPAITSLAKQDFKSTIFVPHSAGEFFPGTQTRIIKQLGSKPLCAVYLARDIDGRMLTVKQFYLADETEETKAFAKIMRREYDLLSAIDHPGIAKVVNSFTVDYSTYLSIEHRPGIDLRAIVKEHGPRSESLTISWALDLCRIMLYLHSREPAILHRDLTPDNIVAAEDGQLRLIDFGAAREFLEGITGTMIGKQCYIAPEQLRGDANQKSDIYGFGCTLYFLLTGRDPVALSQSSPATVVSCSENFDKLIRACTSFDEQNRPQSFEEVLLRLNELDQGFRIKFPAQKSKVVA